MDWRKHFPEEILKRGHEYCKSGRVEDFNYMNTHLYARVLGYKPYNVRITFSGDEITEMYCDCRYGGNCKHQAAVLYHLEDNQTLGEDCTNLLSLFSHGELVEFLAEELPNNPELLNRMRLLKNVKVDSQYYIEKLHKCFESPVLVINFIDVDLVKLSDIDLMIKLTGLVIDYLDYLNDEGLYDAYDDVFEKIEDLINHLLDLGYVEQVCDMLAHYIQNSYDDGLCDVFSDIYSRYRDVDKSTVTRPHTPRLL